jgi:MoxR-like ATPase
MQEQKVTIFGTEYSLEPPFIVLATQNPLEMEGTYPLPEAQIDRFFFKLMVSYPNTGQLLEIIDKTTENYEPDLKKILDSDSIIEMKNLVKQVPIASHVKNYAIRLVLATHPNDKDATEHTNNYVRFGASPRGLQSMVMAGKVCALIKGRYNVAFEDIKEAALPALRHRIILNMRGEAEGVNPEDIIADIVKRVHE